MCCIADDDDLAIGPRADRINVADAPSVNSRVNVKEGIHLPAKVLEIFFGALAWDIGDEARPLLVKLLRKFLFCCIADDLKFARIDVVAENATLVQWTACW